MSPIVSMASGGFHRQCKSGVLGARMCFSDISKSYFSFQHEEELPQQLLEAQITTFRKPVALTLSVKSQISLKEQVVS